MSLHHTKLNSADYDTKCTIRRGWVRWEATRGNHSGWLVAYHKDIDNRHGYVPGKHYRSGGASRNCLENADALFVVQSSADHKWYVGHWHYGKYANGFDEVAGPFKTAKLAKVALELLQ